MTMITTRLEPRQKRLKEMLDKALTPCEGAYVGILVLFRFMKRHFDEDFLDAVREANNRSENGIGVFGDYEEQFETVMNCEPFVSAFNNKNGTGITGFKCLDHKPELPDNESGKAATELSGMIEAELADHEGSVGIRRVYENLWRRHPQDMDRVLLAMDGYGGMPFEKFRTVVESFSDKFEYSVSDRILTVTKNRQGEDAGKEDAEQSELRDETSVACDKHVAEYSAEFSRILGDYIDCGATTGFVVNLKRKVDAGEIALADALVEFSRLYQHIRDDNIYDEKCEFIAKKALDALEAARDAYNAKTEAAYPDTCKRSGRSNIGGKSDSKTECIAGIKISGADTEMLEKLQPLMQNAADFFGTHWIQDGDGDWVLYKKPEIFVRTVDVRMDCEINRMHAMDGSGKTVAVMGVRISDSTDPDFRGKFVGNVASPDGRHVAGPFIEEDEAVLADRLEAEARKLQEK